MTSIILSQATQNAIDLAVTVGPGVNNQNYLAAYNAISNEIKATGSFNSGTLNWFSMAGTVNSQQYAASAAGTYIWNYTIAAAKAQGTTLTADDLQQASNAIAKTVFEQLMAAHFVFSDNPLDPTNFAPKTIVQVDAGSGLTKLANLHPDSNLTTAIWGGTLFARILLNDPTYFSDNNINLSPGSADCAAITSGSMGAINSVLANLGNLISNLPSIIWSGEVANAYQGTVNAIASQDNAAVRACFPNQHGSLTNGSLTITADENGSLIYSQNNGPGQSIQTATVHNDDSLTLSSLDTNGQPWSVQTLEFDASQRLTKIETLNDAGTRQTTNYDVAGNQAWSSLVIDYTVSGNMADVTYNNDDSSKDVVTMDAAGAYSWSSHQDHYDAAGRLTNQVGANDDQTFWSEDYDPTGQYSWSVVHYAFDSGWHVLSKGHEQRRPHPNAHQLRRRRHPGLVFACHRLQRQRQHGRRHLQQRRRQQGCRHQRCGKYLFLELARGPLRFRGPADGSWHVLAKTGIDDNGTHWSDNYDPYGVQPWTSFHTVYDNFGNIVSQTGDNDNGTHWTINADPANTQPWSSFHTDYDSAWNISGQTGDNDNGTHWTLNVDLANSQPWSSVHTDYNSGWQSTEQNWTYDNGTHTVYNYDVANTVSWSNEVTHYDAQGHMTDETVNNDNGSHVDYWYDAANTNSASSISNEYSPTGQWLDRIVNYDNGTHHVDAIDAGNLYPWSSITADFDPGWHLTSGVKYDDHGTSVTLGFSIPLDTVASILSAALAAASEIFGFLPVVLDLDGNGIDVTPLGSSTAMFDIDPQPGREHTAWVRPGDGLLAIDLAAGGQAGPDGKIDQVSEIAFTKFAPDAGSDMAALRQAFDTNHNGRLDGGDARWSEFIVWQDGNSDGVSQASELHTLSDLGIVSLDLNPAGPAKHLGDGSVVSGQSLYAKADGSVGLAGDVGFAYELAHHGPESGVTRGGEFLLH